MTYDNFKKNIRTWVADTLGVEVIFSHGSGPRPNGQYAVVNILSISKPIEDVRTEIRQDNGDITASYEGIRKVMISINIYRDESTEQMIKLKGSLSRILVQDYFNNLDIGIVEPSQTNRIPEQIGKSWENRSQCDFFFHYLPDIESDPDISEIKHVEVTNEINGDLIST